MDRPTGIFILSIVHFIVGGIILLMILSLAIYSLTIDQYLNPLYGNLSINIFPRGFGMAMALNLFILLLISLITIITGIGLMDGWPWIWYVETLLIISLIFNIIFISISMIQPPITIIIPILILYYLNRPHVKEYFFLSEGYKESRDMEYQ